MYANREGTFNAYPANIGVTDSGPNNLATVIIGFRLFEELVNGEWTDCSQEAIDVTGYFYLEKKDGQVNNVAVDALRAALNWTTDDPAWLQQTDLSQVPVQLKLGNEEYNGKTKVKVQFLNPYGSTAGGVPKGDEQTHQAIRMRLSDKLRAYMGGTPAPAPNPVPRTAPAQKAPVPQAQPPIVPPPAKKTMPPARPPVATATLEQAWEEFGRHCQGDKWSQDEVENEWFRIIAELFPGKQTDQLSGTEWQVMLTEGHTKIIPF